MSGVVKDDLYRGIGRERPGGADRRYRLVVTEADDDAPRDPESGGAQSRCGRGVGGHHPVAAIAGQSGAFPVLLDHDDVVWMSAAAEREARERGAHLAETADQEGLDPQHAAGLPQAHGRCTRFYGIFMRVMGGFPSGRTGSALSPQSREIEGRRTVGEQVAAVETDEAVPPVRRAGGIALVSARGDGSWTDYLWSALSVALLTLAAKSVEPWIGYPSIDLFYLVPVILAATLFGLRPGIATALASGFAYNFFFLPPHYSLAVHDPQDVITATVLVLVAVVTSQLAGRVRTQAKAGEQSARDNAAIASFVTMLGTLSDEAETARAICSEVARLFDVDAIMLVRDGAGLAVAATAPGRHRLDPGKIETAEEAFRGERAGSGPATCPASEWQFWPLKGSLGTLAVLGVARTGAREPIPPGRSVMFAQVLDRAARACERLRVEAEMRHVVALRERDHLRTTLLSSIGHDLRTPLTAVTAAAEAMASDASNEELVSTIRSEAARLNRFFDDLIDVTRIEAGALAPKLEAVDLTDAVSAALDDLRPTLTGRPVGLEVPADLPLVQTDPSLLHHILINLLDNAAKFSLDAGKIVLRGETAGGGVRLSVLDRGPGLPAGREEAVFDTFARLEGSDRTGGTGLGLAIVKGFAEAMGLSVEAANRSDGRGASFSLFFPATSLVAPSGADA